LCDNRGVSEITPLQLPPCRWLRSFKHQGFYEAMIVHPDGERLIAAQRDGSITIWNLADGRVLHHLTSSLSASELDEARSLHMRLHPDGVRLFVTVVIIDTSDVTFCWDLTSHVLVETYEYPEVPEHFAPGDLAITPHGLWLTLWELGTQTIRTELYRAERSWHVSDVLSPATGSSSVAALVHAAEGLELWDFEKRERRWLIPGAIAERGYGSPLDEGQLGDAVALPGGEVLVSRRGALEVRSADDASLRRTIPCPIFGLITLDHARRRAVIQGAEELCAIDLASGAVLSSFAASEVDSVKLDREGAHAVIRTGFGLSSLVWELETGACRLRANDPLELVPGSPGQPPTAITLEGYILRQWALGEDAVATAPSSPRPPYPTTCPAGTVAFSVTPAGKLRLQRVADGAKGKAPEGPSVELSPRGYPRVLALEPDAQRIALSVGHSTGQTIELWRGTAPPLRLHTFRSLTSASSAAFDPTRRWLVSGHHDGSLHLWDTHERRRASLVETGPTTVIEVAISPSGDRLVTLSPDQRIRGFSLEGLTPLSHWDSESALHELHWLDDETLAASSADGEIRLRWPAPQS
jgi:WD40 repeat protein